MGDIYKSAAKVVIWLGQSNERVEAAIRQVEELAHMAQTGNVGDRRAINYANRRATQNALRERVVRISSSKLPLIALRYLPIDIDTGTTHASDDAFGPLFECSWFYRVWTIQECTLPFFHRITLRCGILEVSWPAVFMVADLLKGAQYRWGRYEEAMSLQTRIVTYLISQRIEGARAVLNQNSGVLQNDPLMFSILEDVRMKQATNPKDKIIGMYGLLKDWVEVSRSIDYPTGELSKKALQRTLVYDQPENNADAVRDNAFNDWYHNMCLEDMDEVARRSRDTASSRTPDTTSATTSDAILTWRLFGTNKFHTLAHMFSSKKCFFSTAKNYFGTAPDPLPVSMMEGDKIAIISGLEMPLLLRPVGDKYRLITHVYVHGIMYGEMWSAIEHCLDEIILL
ncbi:unnamed protein product [Alternaria alternata]